MEEVLAILPGKSAPPQSGSFGSRRGRSCHPQVLCGPCTGHKRSQIWWHQYLDGPSPACTDHLTDSRWSRSTLQSTPIGQVYLEDTLYCSKIYPNAWKFANIQRAHINMNIIFHGFGSKKYVGFPILCIMSLPINICLGMLLADTSLHPKVPKCFMDTPPPLSIRQFTWLIPQGYP